MIRNRLVEHGFENVAVRGARGKTTVWYENRIYRYEMTGLGVVAGIAAEELPPEEALTLVPQSLGLSILSVSAPAGSWMALITGEISDDEFRSSLTVSRGGAARRPARWNSSRGRADVAVRPLWAFELGQFNDVYQASFALAPEIVMSPVGGTLLTGQVMMRLTNDLQPDARDVVPGRNTLSWAGWLPGVALLAASGGIFPDDRYGVALEAGRLAFDGKLELTAGGDLSGRLEFTRDEVLYSRMESWSAFAAATGRTPGVDLELRGSVARFIEGDFGVRVDVARRFQEARVAFFGIKTETDNVAGVQLVLPLPVKRLSRPRRLRVATVPTFPIEYRDRLGNIGRQLNHFNDTEWVRKGLFPTFVRNNIGDVRNAAPYVEAAR